ncbi:MAG TPA: arsenate reductase ArsC [Bacteroidota bacterium]|nr:arsenate reductase ArsC [Bacteroidota bacterium]
MKRILILCTGNSCRSQMAEGILKSFDNRLEVFSAGTHPAPAVHPLAIKVMHEIGIDISANKTKNVASFLPRQFDYVVTVCDSARESCPVFSGTVRHRIHYSFEDPAEARGTEEILLNEFRRVRDGIKVKFEELYTAIKTEMPISD